MNHGSWGFDPVQAEWTGSPTCRQHRRRSELPERSGSSAHAGGEAFSEHRERTPKSRRACPQNLHVFGKSPPQFPGLLVGDPYGQPPALLHSIQIRIELNFPGGIRRRVCSQPRSTGVPAERTPGKRSRSALWSALPWMGTPFDMECPAPRGGPNGGAALSERRPPYARHALSSTPWKS